MIITVLAGCAPAEVEVPDLAPLEENLARPPEARPGDPYPEAIETVSGGDESLWWAHGAGYVRASARATWDALLDPDVGVDRREVDEWTVTDDPRPKLDASYVVTNIVHDVITVDYDLWWRHEAQTGPLDDPERVVIVWSKIAGTPFIELIEDSIVVTAVEDEVAQIEVVAHLEAAQRDDATLVSYLEDLHASIVAAVHGEPLPVYRR